MNASSSPLPTGWITVWIALGVLALGIFIALPLAVSQKSQKEFARFQACAAKTQTTNCEPSLAWALNGWSLASSVAPLTETAPATSTDAVPASSTQPAR